MKTATEIATKGMFKTVGLINKIEDIFIERRKEGIYIRNKKEILKRWINFKKELYPKYL